MAAPAQSAEQRELSLVGKVEMRIALTDTDPKLEAVLKTYLAPLLLKLVSPHASVRSKVISICQHIDKRIQPQTIQLPVAALVKQYKEQESPLVRNLDLRYIQQGASRLPVKEKADLLPVIVGGIAGSSSQEAGARGSRTHGPQIFNLMLRLLESFTLPPRGSKDDLDLRSTMNVSTEDAKYLADRIGKLLLFTPQRTPSTASCPGLTQSDYDFFALTGTNEDAWNPSAGGLNLFRTKALAARLVASGLFTDAERFLPALYASADPASSVSDVGDDMLKRALPATDLEDERLIRQLYNLYFGTSQPESRSQRVKAPLRLKILGLLNKSTKSTTFAEQIISLVDDGVSASQQDGDDVVMSNGIPQASNIGREASKLRAAIFTYINFVARYGAKETLHAIAAKVVNRLRDFIENQGWPRPGQSEDLVSRGYAYEVIGLLCRAGPRSILVEEDRPSLDLLRWLFSSLARDSSGNSITVSIEESMSTVLNALGRVSLSQSEQDVLEGLLIDQMIQSASLEEHNRLRSTRYVAVRLANRCLPYSSTRARWVDCLAAGAQSDRAEVREEGERGLSPYWHQMLRGSTSSAAEMETDPPGASEIVELFFVNQVSITSTDPMTLVQQARKSNETAFPFLTSFARRNLFHQAVRNSGNKVKLDSEWERKVDGMVESDPTARSATKVYLKGIMSRSPKTLDILLCALFECIATSSMSAEDDLVEFLALAPQDLIQNHVARASDLMVTLKSNNHSRRMTAAQAFGILTSHPSASNSQRSNVRTLLDLAQDWSTAVGTKASAMHGAITALGFYYSRLSYRQNNPPTSDEYKGFLKVLFNVFADCKDDLLQEAAFLAIGQMCMYRCLTPETIEQHIKIRSVTDKLFDKAKAGNEVAILSLGQLTMILPESDGTDGELRHIEVQLHKLHEIRQSEVHFTVGEAFSYLISGWDSSALATKLDIDGRNPSSPPRSQTIVRLLDQVLADCLNTKPALKKAAVMWLLCLVQFCGTLPHVQERLAECQNAFRRCLADRDELVQESASRGLGLVYEKGDRKLKDDLVRELVSSFSSDKQQLAGNVTNDTQLFEPGALPTGDGSVSTYKDIMSLASEVGDSSLVYRFMSMASSNAIWSSRAAFGRFGLSSVLSDSSVDGYLANNPKLYPKLYRYRFDPNGGVQRSMNEIWDALVPDSAATIGKYFDAIMEDLLVSILGKEWRVRQACCAAIADLVQGRTLEKYEKYLERIWTQCFKVLDDIKESVRAAASSLARTLTGVLTRALEADHSSTKNASAMLKHVLPFLLSPSGMESSAQDVQLFSVHTLLEIIKKANGATIRTFIPELVERLIGLLSSLEPEAVNYVHLNAAKYNLTEQKIDDMRLSSVRSSPLMEAIERCLDLLDEDTMQKLQPRLESAMKGAVGLPSKVGSSRILVSLSTRRMVIFQPYVDENLRLLEKLIIDRNETVSSSFAVAAGYLSRGASEKQTLRLIDFAKRLYFESEGDREAVVPKRSITSGELMFAMAKHASDKFNAFATSALPFVFVAKHDSNEQVREQFQETWNESVGGSRAVQLYLKEILELCMLHLDSAQWTLKHTAARAVADAVVAVSSSEVEMSSAIGRQIWPALEKALSGKTWEGKEVVLRALVKYVGSGKQYYMQDDDVRSAIVKIAVREAKRQNAGYRPHSIQALAEICASRDDVSMADTASEIAASALADDIDEDAMEVDGKDTKRRAEEMKERTTCAAIDALFASINPAVSPRAELTKHTSRAVAVVVKLRDKSPAAWRHIYRSLEGLIDRMGKHESALQPEPMLVRELKSLLFGPVVEIEALREMRAAVLDGMKKTQSGLMEKLLQEST